MSGREGIPRWGQECGDKTFCGLARAWLMITSTEKGQAASASDAGSPRMQKVSNPGPRERETCCLHSPKSTWEERWHWLSAAQSTQKGSPADLPAPCPRQPLPGRWCWGSWRVPSPHLAPVLLSPARIFVYSISFLSHRGERKTEPGRQGEAPAWQGAWPGDVHSSRLWRFGRKDSRDP